MEMFWYEHRQVLKTILIVIIYLLGAFCTYGYTKARMGYNPTEAFGAAALWPAFLAIKGVGYVADFSEQVFTPSPPPKPEKG